MYTVRMLSEAIVAIDLQLRCSDIKPSWCPSLKDSFTQSIFILRVWPPSGQSYGLIHFWVNKFQYQLWIKPLQFTDKWKCKQQSDHAGAKYDGTIGKPFNNENIFVLLLC